MDPAAAGARFDYQLRTTRAASVYRQTSQSHRPRCPEGRRRQQVLTIRAVKRLRLLARAANTVAIATGKITVSQMWPHRLRLDRPDECKSLMQRDSGRHFPTDQSKQIADYASCLRNRTPKCREPIPLHRSQPLRDRAISPQPSCSLTTHRRRRGRNGQTFQRCGIEFAVRKSDAERNAQLWLALSRSTTPIIGRIAGDPPLMARLTVRACPRTIPFSSPRQSLDRLELTPADRPTTTIFVTEQGGPCNDRTDSNPAVPPIYGALTWCDPNIGGRR